MGCPALSALPGIIQSDEPAVSADLQQLAEGPESEHARDLAKADVAGPDIARVLAKVTPIQLREGPPQLRGRAPVVGVGVQGQGRGVDGREEPRPVAGGPPPGRAVVTDKGTGCPLV